MQGLADGFHNIPLTTLSFGPDTATKSTQLRLAFPSEVGDTIADGLKFYSGSALGANRPQLVITFTMP